jgi:hypothetical protein
MQPSKSSKNAAAGKGRTIRAVRELDDDCATGEVTVRAAESSGAKHDSLAGARAWAAMAETRLKRDDFTGATLCVQSGLEELGNSYRSPDVIDDTSLAIMKAKDLIKRGRHEEGAKRMLRVLKERLKLYLEAHGAALVE